MYNPLLEIQIACLYWIYGRDILKFEVGIDKEYDPYGNTILSKRELKLDTIHTHLDIHCFFR